ncbi:RNA polymerase sigma factor, partial [Singulisphaera rosea]
MADATLGSVLRQIDSLFREGATAGIGDALLLERFLKDGDAKAFEALVARHGPMVLSVCRAILKNPQDVEDAFQATFLVLAEKARVIRGQHSLAGWLYRVTQNVALRANANAERRRKHERAAGSLRLELEPKDDLHAALLTTLHEEIARLPEKCRLAIVHCYLQGKTHAQAAAELRWGEATVRRKLADARETLRSRLTQRGVALAF